MKMVGGGFCITFKNKRKYINIYCDIYKKYISDMRKCDEFILIYNESKNSSSRTEIGKYFSQKAGKEFGMFGLERYKKLYFQDIHTYTKSEFENFLNEKNIFNPI